MKKFIKASSFAEKIIDGDTKENTDHSEDSPIFEPRDSFVQLPEEMGSIISRLTEIKGYRNCSMCKFKCAYRASETIIDGEYVYINHCQTNNIYFFTRG